MRYNIYRYNPETCQYEHATITFKNVVWYGIGTIITAACMLAGILFLHDFLVDTDTEKNLSKENSALKHHHSILVEQLRELHPTLTSLEYKDRILHKIVFGSQEIVQKDFPVAAKKKLLLADASTFRPLLESVKKTTHQFLLNSLLSNTRYKNKNMQADEQMQLIRSLPTHKPFQYTEGGGLISGFGLRVNPFHKGLYEHLGIDVAMPRGSAVIAAASGVVMLIKRSDLEAGYGNYIEIDHGQGLVTRYAHLQNIDSKLGDKVDKAEVIGTVGTSGGSIAPHLHYEILRNGKNVDPINYMMEGLTSNEHYQLVSMSHQQNQSLD